MILRYITYLIKETGLRILNYFLFPAVWVLRKPLRKKGSGFLWGFLHDGNDYGDKYFLEKHGNKKTFWTAYKWAMRNPLHNYYCTTEIKGKKENYKGWATIQQGKQDKGLMWRTLKTCDKNGIYKDKHGKWLDIEHSILGKQRITFKINSKRYFRYSDCTPKHLWGNLWYCPEYKFGFESVNWAIQFKPIQFKKYKGNKFKYNKIILKPSNNGRIFQ